MLNQLSFLKLQQVFLETENFEKWSHVISWDFRFTCLFLKSHKVFSNCWSLVGRKASLRSQSVTRINKNIWGEFEPEEEEEEEQAAAEDQEEEHE